MYYIGEATTSKDNIEEKLYISMKELREYFYDESLDYKIVSNRIRSQMQHNSHLFLRKKEGGSVFFRLSAEGYKYLNKFKDDFNPITEKIEVF